MTDREKNLEILKKRDTIKNLQITGNGEAFVDILEATVNELKKTLGVGVEIVNIDELISNLAQIGELSEAVGELKDQIKSLQLPNSVGIEGIDDLMANLKMMASRKEHLIKVEPIDPKPFEDIAKSIVDLTLKVEELSAEKPKPGQEPGDYIPMRRVMKVGNKLLYDDSFYTGGGGGGSNTPLATGGTAVAVLNPDGTEIMQDVTASGTITTQNLNPNSGVATAGSTVALSAVNGYNTLTIQTVGTYTGALTLQGTVDGTNWISFAGSQILNNNTGLYLATITSALQSTFQAKISGFTQVRISALAAVTGSVDVTLRASMGDAYQGSIGVVALVTAMTTLTTLTNITNWGNIVDNAAFTDGTTRLSPNAYIYDEVAGTALTENDAAAARIDEKRAQIGIIEDGTTRGRRATVTAQGALLAEGTVANGVADTGNPVKIGGKASTSTSSAVTDGQRVDAEFSKTGKQVVIGTLREQMANQITTITSSTSETTIVTADATYFMDVYALIITNTSATATKVTIKDSTAGTTRMVFQVPATDTRGFMLSVDAGHKQATVNNNWTATCGTSVADIVITALVNKRL